MAMTSRLFQWSIKELRNCDSVNAKRLGENRVFSQPLAVFVSVKLKPTLTLA